MQITYYDIQKEMNSLRLEVEDMDDEDLIDEVNFITYYESGEVHEITGRFFNVTGKLNGEEREGLIMFYVLANMECYWEDGEEKW